MRHHLPAFTANILIALATLTACGGGENASPAPAPTVTAAGTMTGTGAAESEVTNTVTLALDGTGQYRTLKDAFAAVPDNSAVRTIIMIKPGTYEGQAILTRNKHKVTLQGTGPGQTVLSYNANVYEQPPGTHDFYKGYGVVIESSDFRANNITFRNTSGDHGQAIALRLNGDRSVISNSRFLGWQDTLNVNNGRHYFKDCYIEGRVDFIYGDGTAVFNRCEIKSKNGGYITASSAPQTRPYGFVFMNSRLTSDPTPWDDPNSTSPVVTPVPPAQAYLGRPWRPYAAVIFLNTAMGAHIKPAGWHNWGNAANELTARYAEYGSTGLGANNDLRVKWSKILSQEEAAKLTLTAILGGADNWKPE